MDDPSSVRIERRAIKKVAFTNRAGRSIAYMRRCYELGLELYVEQTKQGDLGSGKPLPQEW